MTYTTKHCPHCNEQLSFMEPKKIAYGSPLRTCPRCQKTYIDKSYQEIAISGKPSVYPVSPFSIIMLLFILFGLVAILIEYRGNTFLPVCACVFLMIIFAIPMIGDWKSYNERRSAIFLETLQSEQRLSNPEYATILKELGYRVPEKYLFPKSNKTATGKDYVDAPIPNYSTNKCETESNDSQQAATQKKQLEEIAVFRHDLLVNYAQGNISEQEFDDALDCIYQMESEAGISMLDADKIDYERIYRSVQLKAEAKSQMPSLNQVNSKQKGSKVPHRIALITIIFVLCICAFVPLVVYMNSSDFPVKTSFFNTPTTKISDEYKTAPKRGVSLSSTVYISSNGHKIHTSSNCSGMKYFFRLSYDEACKAGYEHCDICF